MDRTHRPHDEATSEMFQRDPALAADYLTDVLSNGDDVDVMLALRTLSAAFGGVQAVARRADANPNTMYRTLSKQGNPSLKTLRAILGAMGLRLAVHPIEPDRSSPIAP